MEIFVIVLALAFLQVWGSRNPLHKDGWFLWWQQKLGRLFSVRSELNHFLSIALLLVIVALFFELLVRQSPWLSLPLAVIVVLYSFGRGEFFEIVREYTQACYVEDWDSATDRAARFDVDVESITKDDWSGLHRQVLDEAGYRGFERMFAVLFWFFMLGPIGALMYRLVFIQVRNDSDDALSARWLWILEWPAVRVMGLTFALTGNFSGCVEHLKECLVCAKRSTIDVLSPMILGALSVSEEVQPDCEITRKELTLMSKLYKRTLWFWLAAVSFVIIFI